MVLSMDRWVGKVAIVTGATSGIGAAVADALVENGLLVAGIDLNEERVERIRERAKLSTKKGKLYGVKADLTKEEEILTAFKWIGDNLGPVHVLVNCAGYAKEGFLTETTTEDWKRTINTNVIGLCITTREAIKIMRANGINGHIVHINSILRHFHPVQPELNVYSGTKSAVTALTETLRQELNSLKSKIKITSVSPGLVLTEMTLLNKDISEARRQMFADSPILEGQDIADGVVYVLATPEHVQVHELTIKPIGESS